jgi:hypothetical protein
LELKGNIFVYSPKGEQLEEIKVPNKSAKNLCFGRGEFSKTLFITTSKKLYTIEINKEGFHAARMSSLTIPGVNLQYKEFRSFSVNNCRGTNRGEKVIPLSERLGIIGGLRGCRYFRRLH